MKKKTITIIVIAALLLAAVPLYYFNAGPGSQPGVDETEEVEKVEPVGPAFNADSAYAFTKAQCDFGPRPMNSVGHERCLDWIVGKFSQYGCEVTRQKADLKGFDGTVLHSINIIARFRPEAKRRIMLCAHWDSRPWADNDPDSANWRKPILAANDAASGVAVMLEVARLLNDSDASTGHRVNAEIGVDFVCFDAEDWGVPQWSDAPDDGSSWALGAQYWAENVDPADKPMYAILLDMVGGQGAKFYREGMSMQYASDIVKKVWRAARKAGYGSFFPRQEGGMVTDDHLPVNEKAGIPCIDVIAYYPECQQSSFGPTWHTMADNMDNIDRNTLKAVGQTMIQVIYSEE